MKRTHDGSALRSCVLAWVFLLLIALPACATNVKPANWAFQWQGWSLEPSHRVFTEHCVEPLGGPRWEIRAGGRNYDQSDYALLGTGDGTIDFAPLNAYAAATAYDWTKTQGTRRLRAIPTPLADQIVTGAESETMVRLYLSGGGVLDARWVERARPEAHGVDLQGQPFRIPDDTIKLAQGREAIAGIGAGRVGLRITNEYGASHIDYGLNARVPRDKEAAKALTEHGFIQIPAKDLLRVKMSGRRFSAIPGLVGSLALKAPLEISFSGTSALLVSLRSILLAPVSRTPAGVRTVSAPYGEAPRIGESGVSNGMLWMALLPPEGSRSLWLLPGGGTHARFVHGSAMRDAPALDRNGNSLVAPVLLDPGTGTRIAFKSEEVPDKFELIVPEFQTLDGTKSERSVYKMKRKNRIMWNPISVWREWKCD